jgi:CPA2 family monovalent cation:H+ antiporter-2
VLNRYFIPMDEIERHIGEIRRDGYEMFRNMQHKYTVYPELKQRLPDVEIETIRIDAESPVSGKTLAELDLRKSYGSTVLAVQRDRQTITNPSGDIQLLAQDIVVLVGTRDSITLTKALTLPPAKL